ncbi:Yip1 family protein [Anaerobacillus sp. 1_MG-2023]|uniref:Yip1 family protein n=1 Tax=Anaerobacillus sp. 1_MG-2023 TaxID=3062655 RepID=UPI0026E37EE6|nr:Yip1 family protein [Anaerobacillus sp. 1_MG-2023]MDO6658470.1 Yip1 family protein [Anaerobacillus sp. 1_MG-2023]
MNEDYEEKGNAAKPSLLGMIWSPGEQFKSIRQAPKVWLPLIVVTVLSLIGGWLMILGPGFEEQFATGDLQGENVDGLILFTKIITIVSVGVGPVLSILVGSFILWLINKATSSEVTFKQFFSMNTYIGFIGAIGAVLNGLIIAIVGGTVDKLYTSLGSLVSGEGFLGGFLNGIEIFGIWTIILTALGLRITAQWPKALVWTIVIILFLFTIGGAVITGVTNNMSGI